MGTTTTKKVKVNGQVIEATNASLSPLIFKGYWADTNGVRIDKISFGSKVRFYIERWQAYNAKLKIYIKSSVKDVPIVEGAIDKLIDGYFTKRELYYEMTLNKLSQYESLRGAQNIELCCDVAKGFGSYGEVREVAKIKIEILSLFCDPLYNMQIRYNRASNLFGKVRNSSTKPHQGFDYYAAIGTDIIAVADGEVVHIVYPALGDYGAQLTVKLDDGEYYAFYAHLSMISVKVGDLVRQGDVLGKTGKTGNASAFKGNELHLHFECRTTLVVGKGLHGRINPNAIVSTKFYSQDETKINQANVGVKKVNNNIETIMNLMK